MPRLLTYSESHWFAILVLIAAGILVWRRWYGVAVVTAVFAAGGLLLTGLTLTVGDGPSHVPSWLVALAASGFLLAGVWLAATKGWSYRLAASLFALGLFGLGGWVEADLGAGVMEVYRSAVGLQFVRPWWLLLLGFVPVVVLMARRSLSGLGPVRKWVAITTRCLIVACLAAALAEPRVKRTSEHVTVLFLIDRSYSIPQDLVEVDPATVADGKKREPIDRRWLRLREFVDLAVQKRGPAHRNDRAGVILFGKRPRLVLPPAAVDRMPIDELAAGPIDGNYTDVAAALKLALASYPEGTAKRVVLVSDGNENIGSAEEQAALARQNEVQIDTIALAPGYRNENEVLVQAVEAPPLTTTGTRLPVRVLVRNANPTRAVEGLLDVVQVRPDGERPVPIEDGPQVLDKAKQPARVRLVPGLNSFRFRDRTEDTPREESSFSYRATFTPLLSADEAGRNVVAGLPGDRVTNNRATTAVVARGQRRVLFLEDRPPRGPSPHQHLLDALLRAKVRVDAAAVSQLPGDKDDLGIFLSNYDCLVIANVPAESFTNDQMEMIRTTVHDQGCGLVMVGGPDAYGPGGYQQTPVEAALPVDCEIKALKAAGKGGLVLVMHASEMADGNFWQQKIARLAIERLGASDMIGVLQYGFGTGNGNGVQWHIPFQEIGDNRRALLAKIDSLVPGDMPDFDPFLTAAVDTLTDPKHNLGVKHCIVISDGDPIYGAAGRAAVTKMAANGVTCTTVGVATHSQAESGKLRGIAAATKDGAGKPGRYYEPKTGSDLPAIYIKESRRVSQSFIYDKVFNPKPVSLSGPAEAMPRALPPLHGFVRTSLKESAFADMHVEGPNVFDQRFPIFASWRYGLGKAVAFTSDARTVPDAGVLGWDKEWASSDVYQKFWEQAVNWAMREVERGRVSVATEYREGRVRVRVDVRDDRDKAVSGLVIRSAVTPPKPPEGGQKPPVLDFKPKGPGQYEAEFVAEEAGAYFVNVQAWLESIGADGKKGLKLFDAARAGATVPYSPEFADLESNTPLLKRLAELTGGTSHAETDETLEELIRTGELFREAPKTVRAILPFWFWLVFFAGTLLVVDVGVRRISVDPAEVRTGARKLWARLRAKPVVEDDPAGLSRLLQRKAVVEEERARAKAGRKFDFGVGPPPATDVPRGADEFAADLPKAPLPTLPERPSEPKKEEPEDFFTRMQKAKKRAQRDDKE